MLMSLEGGLRKNRRRTMDSTRRQQISCGIFEDKPDLIWLVKYTEKHVYWSMSKTITHKPTATTLHSNTRKKNVSPPQPKRRTTRLPTWIRWIRGHTPPMHQIKHYKKNKHIVRIPRPKKSILLCQALRVCWPYTESQKR